uniref:Uncharacterized protein n=1 Tax=Aegilops tauschii TaxID=37682 RepID=R7W8H9_AEGTA
MAAPLFSECITLNLQVYEQKSKCRLQDISGCFLFVQSDKSRDMIHVHEATDGYALFVTGNISDQQCLGHWRVSKYQGRLQEVLTEADQCVDNLNNKVLRRPWDVGYWSFGGYRSYILAGGKTKWPYTFAFYTKKPRQILQGQKSSCRLRARSLVVVYFSENLQDTVCCNKAIAWFLKLATPDGSPIYMQVRIHGKFPVLAYSVLEAMDFSWRRTLFSTSFNIMPTPEVAAVVHKILSPVPLPMKTCNFGMGVCDQTHYCHKQWRSYLGANLGHGPPSS